MNLATGQLIKINRTSILELVFRTYSSSKTVLNEFN